MIRNLTQQNFKGFGTIFTERVPISDPPEVGMSLYTLELRQDNTPIYLAKSNTFFPQGSGMVVLSVSVDGTVFQHYYLDKPVAIQQGIYYCLSPFRVTSTTASLWTAIPPESTGRQCDSSDFHIRQGCHATALYTFFYQERERGFLFPGEAHPIYELTYVDRGSLHSVVDGVDLLVEQGEIVLYGPDQWHMQYADTDVAPRYVTISFEADGWDLQLLQNRTCKAPQAAVSILQQMLREQERMDAYATDMMLSQLTMLLLILLRHTDTTNVRLTNSNAIHSENQIIRRAQQYVSTHIREKLSVPLVAKMVDVSPSYLTALFHKHLQISPGEYIRRIKLQESKQMIRDHSMNFTEIAAALHYSTVHHFSRQFKEKFGITPTEYARSVR